MLAPITHILPLTTIVRRRMLPVPGEVTVRSGQKVNPGDVVAEASVAREHVLIEVARGLDLPPDDADKHIKCRRGDKVNKGDIVADAEGLVVREVRSPVAGRVVAAGGGQVLLETSMATYDLKAGIPGTVSEVVEGRGVVIRGTGALIQGVWGNGRIETGVMLNLAETPDAILTTAQLDVSLRGSVILSGHVNEEKTLKTAAELPLRGLIIASLAVDLIPQAQQIKFPILVLDGFGHRPMNQVAYKLLTTNAKREVALNAEAYDRVAGTRPEMVIPLPVAVEPDEPSEAVEFAPGQTVRARRAPYAGAIGILISLRPGLTQMPSGLRVPAADVKFETGETAAIPLANLEVLG